MFVPVAAHAELTITSTGVDAPGENGSDTVVDLSTGTTVKSNCTVTTSGFRSCTVDTDQSSGPNVSSYRSSYPAIQNDVVVAEQVNANSDALAFAVQTGACPSQIAQTRLNWIITESDIGAFGAPVKYDVTSADQIGFGHAIYDPAHGQMIMDASYSLKAFGLAPGYTPRYAQLSGCVNGVDNMIGAGDHDGELDISVANAFVYSSLTGNRFVGLPEQAVTLSSMTGGWGAFYYQSNAQVYSNATYQFNSSIVTNSGKQYLEFVGTALSDVTDATSIISGQGITIDLDVQSANAPGPGMARGTVTYEANGNATGKILCLLNQGTGGRDVILCVAGTSTKQPATFIAVSQYPSRICSGGCGGTWRFDTITTRKIFHLHNPGPGTATNIDPTTTDPTYYTIGGTCGSSLAAGDSCDIYVDWTSRAGCHVADLNLSYDMYGSPANVTVHLVGTSGLLSIDVTPSPVTVDMNVSTDVQFTATGHFNAAVDGGGTDQDITACVFWTTSDPSTASVGDETGYATCNQKGTAQIQAVVSGYEGDADIDCQKDNNNNNNVPLVQFAGPPGSSGGAGSGGGGWYWWFGGLTYVNSHLDCSSLDPSLGCNCDDPASNIPYNPLTGNLCPMVQYVLPAANCQTKIWSRRTPPSSGSSA